MHPLISLIFFALAYVLFLLAGDALGKGAYVTAVVAGIVALVFVAIFVEGIG